MCRHRGDFVNWHNSAPLPHICVCPHSPSLVYRCVCATEWTDADSKRHRGPLQGEGALELGFQTALQGQGGGVLGSLQKGREVGSQASPISGCLQG